MSAYCCVCVCDAVSSFSSGAICRKHKVFLHTDAAQAVGKVRVDVNDMNIDLMSISGHKLYGPKGAPPLTCSVGLWAGLWACLWVGLWACLWVGVNVYVLPLCSLTGVGALYVRRRPRVRIEPIQSGGGQER